MTIKAVPRQGLSTMYCMTNVMRFQQRYLNWQITNWTRMDNAHIKVHVSVSERALAGRPAGHEMCLPPPTTHPPTHT